jgi:queuine tRNA-ribosyltransferase
MQLDVCTGYGVTQKEALTGVKVTGDWAKRGFEQWKKKQDEGYEGLFFPIVQGNFFEDMRKASAEQLAALDTPGIAIGGLSVGEPFDVYEHFLSYTAALLPRDKPRYVMGIGTPEFILEAIQNGIDMFDCVLPTRNGRNGSYFTRYGFRSIKNSRFADDYSPPDNDCTCKVCKRYSRAYLHHLYKEREILSSMLASYHNLSFLHTMVKEAREAIHAGNFPAYKADFLSKFYGKR